MSRRAELTGDGVRMLVVGLDEAGRVTSLNRHASEVSGLTEGEAAGRPFTDFLTPEEADRARELLAALTADSAAPWLRAALLGKDGASAIIDWRFAPVVGEDGKLEGVLAVGVEVPQPALRVEEGLALLDLLFEQSPAALSLMDCEFKVVRVNSNYSRLIGRSAADLVGHSQFEVTEERYRPVFEKAATGEVFGVKAMPYPSRPDPGVAPSYWDWRIQPIFGEAGEICFLLLRGQNVTESVLEGRARLEAEAAVVEQARLADAFFASSISPLAILDREFTYVRVNDAYARAFGWNASDFPGQNRFELLEDPVGIRPIFEEAVSTGRPYSVQAAPIPLLLSPDEGIRYWDWTIEPLLDDAGEVEYLVVASMEVTDRVRAEREKQAAQEQMTELLRLHEASFNQSLTCLVLLDRDFNFLQVNEAYARSCGMQVVDFAGRNHFELFPSDAQDIFEEVVRTKEPSIVTARPFSFPDHPEWGVTYWDWVLQPILDEQGEVHFLLWMLQDVTHRREAEDALMEYQQDLRFMASELALAEERARRAIAVEIHDGLGQHLAVMRMKLANLRQTAILPEVRQMASDLLEHLGEAIHYARFLTFELSPPVLYDLGLEPALGWLTDQFRTRHGLDLTLEDDGLPKPLSQDLRVTVFRSARELLTNVVKHAQAEHVKVSVTSDGTRLHVEVEDDGCGFDTSMLEGQHPQQGGFGLFSVIERMRHLGGSVEIVSQPGGGTRARLSAPLEEAAAGCEEEFV